jgi:uncharacterized protein (TIGR00645 family)
VACAANGAPLDRGLHISQDEHQHPGRAKTMPNTRPRLEVAVEAILFASRWILAPFYLGMVVALLVLLFVFGRELVTELAHLSAIHSEEAILLALSLIDLSLTGNLLLIVIFSGYENFVSKIHVAAHEDRPSWMGTVDFSGLKIKLIASIVAISAIALLRAFLPLGDAGAEVDNGRLRWMVIIHLTFIASGVFMAATDWITSNTKQHAES